LFEREAILADIIGAVQHSHGGTCTMASDKYKHLIKPLSIGAVDFEKLEKTQSRMAIGPGNAGREIRLNGRDHLEGMNLNFSWGVHTTLGDWHAGLDPHVHPYPECLLFVGLDTANVNYLGAEVDCCLGEEQEIYTFNEPTVITVPAGMPHGPISTKRVFSPRGFGFWAVELNRVSEITWLGESVSTLSVEQKKAAPEGMNFASPEKILRSKPAPATGKYAHLVKPISSGLLVERGKLKGGGEKLGPGNADHLILLTGKDLEGLDASIFWGFCSQPGIWRRGAGAHVHPADEALLYLGIDPDDQNRLGAEIEIDLGAEHERHLFNKPSVVICHAGTPHLPQVTRWVDRPFAFFAITLSGEHETQPFD
jgi:hypothetical protein